MARRGEGDRSKLPLWAQRQIARLEMRNRELRERLGYRDDPTVDTLVGEGYRDERPLGNGLRIKFVLERVPDANGDLYARQWFEARLDGGRLLISGDSGLAVHPKAANVVEVERVSR